MTAEPRVSRDHQVIVIGRKGSGKSLAIRHIAAFVVGRLVVHNSKNDPELSKHLRERYDAVQVRHKPKELAKAMRDHRVVEYIPANVLDQEEADQFYRELAKWHDLTVWLDECAGPTSSSRIPPGIMQYLQHGRFKRLRHMGATQRPRHIAKPLLTEADHLIFFPLGFAASDFDTVAAEMGFKPKDFERIVASMRRDSTYLGEYAHLWYDRTKNVLHRRPGVPLL